MVTDDEVKEAIRSIARAASPSLARRLEIISRGKAAQLAERVSIATACLDGVLLERGLVRTVKHRDYTRTYVLTAAGREYLNARSAKAVSP